ncbi:hypothetical protein [Crateriforma conspicua]|uniref:Uncharacterized protein n=1 Tax=Crateriforma conspicua TaxID=2527996 RepID=A0A5C6FI91_9PLAN|nr:hypothetical protein [Crateriforma conspicua]TWU61975.1 hypothetical protein V7x_36660 [Crateriforma conspicua]
MMDVINELISKPWVLGVISAIAFAVLMTCSVTYDGKRWTYTGGWNKGQQKSDD